MKQSIVSSVLFSVAALAASAQTPTPQQIQQAVQSGALQVTPEMIDAAKSQMPSEVQRSDLTPEEEERRKSEAAFREQQQKLIDETLLEQEKEWVSRRAGYRAYGDDDSASRRFPKGLRRFGHDFFRTNDAIGLGPNAPALPDYILSPGDEILVSTWGADNRSASVVLDKEGMFHFRPLSPIRLGGMRFAAAQQLVISEIEKIHGVTAAVTLGRLRSIRVMVLGEVNAPGSFAVPAGATVTSALFRSGGVTSIGSLRNIQVRRANKVVARLDLYEMMLTGNSQGDIQLLPGDIIFVPLSGPQIAVHGMVKRPAIYEMKVASGPPPAAPAKPLKALEAVELAGGLRSNAFKGRMQLDRVQGNRRNIVLDVELDKVNARSNVTLEDGDILFVDKVLDRVDEAVWLRGNVHRPGRYQYKPGMTVGDLITSLKDLRPETFFEYAHIQRPALDDERPTLLSFNLNEVLAMGARVPLEPRDTVVIYNRYEVVERPVVKAAGVVRRPGTFPYRDAMTVSDLIILAGGLGDAYLPEAHLLRTLYAAENDSLYTQLIKINLRNVLEKNSATDNVTLRAFDSLIVFPRRNFVLPKWVKVSGAVHNPGVFQLADGMGIPELLNAAGGLTKNSFRLNVEVVRRTVEADSVMVRSVKTLRLNDVLEGKAEFELQDADAVYVREVVNAREFTTVKLQGEFNFPGSYEFTTGEKLSSVIRRAGGFTDQAYLRGLVFIRQSVKEQQLQHAEEIGRRLEDQLQTRLQQTTESNEQARIRYALERRQTLLEAIRKGPYLGRVVVKVDRDFRFEGTHWDITLEDGDSLYVGPFPNTVSVLGEVYSPTNIIYTPSSNTVGEALAKAGGVNGFGDYKNTFYVAPDGVVHTPGTMPWYMSFKWKSIEPGGSIIVPAKPPAKDYLEIIAKTTQVLFQMAITVGVVTTLL